MAAKDKAVARTAEASQIAPSMGPARLLWESSMADANERFEQCLAELLKQEGGYADDKRDPGGATNVGVTLRTLAGWRKVDPWTALGKEAVNALGKVEAAGFIAASTGSAATAMRCRPELIWRCSTLRQFAPGSRHQVTARAGVGGPGWAGRSQEHRGAQGAHRHEAGIGPHQCALQPAAELSRTSRDFCRLWPRLDPPCCRNPRRSAGHGRSGRDHFNHEREQSNDHSSGLSHLHRRGVHAAGWPHELLGIDLPSVDGQSAGQLIMEALAVAFLRRGISSEINKS
jgi:hypothetical protein